MMIETYFRQLNDEDKAIAITRLAERMEITEEVMQDILQDMNPLITIENGRAMLFQNTYSRLDHMIKRKLGKIKFGRGKY